jgi:hypothetical protein
LISQVETASSNAAGGDMMARFFLPAIVVAFCPAMPAGVIVNTSIDLNSVEILPATGTLEMLSPLNASAYAAVFDSLGGADSQFNSMDDGAASASASTPYTTANTAASATALTASASSTVSLPGINASAGTVGPGPYGVLCGGSVAPCFNAGGFEIVDSSGGTNPIGVQFTASLSYDQSLSTDNYGLLASSEVIFQLSLPDTGLVPFLFLDNPLSISGPDQSAAATASPVLSSSTTLLTNTPYSLYIEADAESSGLDSPTPEPSSLLLAAGGTAMIFVTLAFTRGRLKRSRS